MLRPKMRPLLVLATGTPVPVVQAVHGDFDAFFRLGVGDAWQGPWATADACALDRPLPALDSFAGVIVTGSSSSVTERAPWMLRLEEWLRGAVDAEVPLLGVCFGHQILAQALGGEVRHNPRGRRIGTLEVQRTPEGADDPLFLGVPGAFAINVSHKDHVAVVPPGVVPLVRADHDELHAFAAGKRARAVQFHPEFHAAIARGYIAARHELLKGEGLDPDALGAAVIDPPYARTILGNFVRGFVAG
ncbi:MAG: glutamine amidotransferase [Polyangiales bacterium]